VSRHGTGAGRAETVGCPGAAGPPDSCAGRLLLLWGQHEKGPLPVQGGKAPDGTCKLVQAEGLSSRLGRRSWPPFGLAPYALAVAASAACPSLSFFEQPPPPAAPPSSPFSSVVDIRRCFPLPCRPHQLLVGAARAPEDQGWLACLCAGG
jgi:hypothetical protein